MSTFATRELAQAWLDAAFTHSEIVSALASSSNLVCSARFAKKTIEDRAKVDIAEGSPADMSERAAGMIDNINAQAEKRGWILGNDGVAIVCGKCRDK